MVLTVGVGCGRVTGAMVPAADGPRYRPVPGGPAWVRCGLVRCGTMAAMGTADHVVLITGATGPLGRAAAAAFAADGARLGLVGTDAGRLDALASDLALADDIVGPGRRRPDGARRRPRRGRDRRTRGSAGSTSCSTSSGGWTGGTALVDLDPDVLAGMLGQHVWSTFHVAQAVVPGMVERGWGRIIAVTSTATAAPGPKASAYVAAKTAQEAMLRVLAREVAGDGVTVNLLAVKAIDAAHERDAAPSPKTADWTTPEEIVAAIRFLVLRRGGRGQRTRGSPSIAEADPALRRCPLNPPGRVAPHPVRVPPAARRARSRSAGDLDPLSERTEAVHPSLPVARRWPSRDPRGQPPARPCPG